MAYMPTTWKDGADGGTPITAARLNKAEQGIAAKAETGPAGPKGATGANGDTGPKGATGAAGADLTSELAALEARVEALEAP